MKPAFEPPGLVRSSVILILKTLVIGTPISAG
jgi:hypothetical protein